MSSARTRWMVTGAIAPILLWLGVARGDDPKAAADALVVEGRRLGDAGKTEEAIAKFKQADRIYPRHIHDCNVGLGYARLGRSPQALFFLERCRARATERLPRWVDRRIKKLVAELDKGGYAPVEIVSSPAGAQVAISAFAADETVTPPAVVWLPLGRHTLTATLRGQDDVAVDVELTDREPRRVELTLEPTPPPEAPITAPEAPITVPEAPIAVAPEAPSPTPVDRAGATWRWVALGTTAAVLAGGLTFHALALDAKGDAEALPPSPRFDRELERFRDLRLGALGCYALAAVGAGVTTWLFLRSPSPGGASAPGSAVGAALGPGSAALFVRWSWE